MTHPQRLGNEEILISNLIKIFITITTTTTIFITTTIITSTITITTTIIYENVHYNAII